jgi:ATP-dependent Zn protease
MKHIFATFAALAFPSYAFGQNAPPDSPLITALITWAPIIFLIGLWIVFMKRTSLFGKGGYREYMRVSQEKVTLIEQHLGDIAASLRTLVDRDPR